MKFTAGAWLFKKLPLNILVAVSLSACGSGGGDSSQGGTPPSQPQASFVLSTDEGGYIFDGERTLYCEPDHEFCEKDAIPGSIESLSAVARFGYAFSHWRRNGTGEISTDAELQLITEISEHIAASFQKLDTASVPTCATTDSAPKSRALHLGDSLTANQCWGNCPTLLYDFSLEPTRESVRFYTSTIAGNTLPPRVIAMGGQRITGTNLYFSPPSAAASGFTTDNYWTYFLDGYEEPINDFDIAVIALGSNDLFDLSRGQVTMDFIFESRVKPLLDWIGNMPVIWVLPYYALRDMPLVSFNLYAHEEGFACTCGDNPPAAAQCDLIQSLQQCGASGQEIQQAVTAFKAVHEFRQRLASLQYEYPNLRVADAAELVARHSLGRYDLYQELQSDYLHLSRQGQDWFAWAQAYLAQTSNPACPWTASVWQMGDAETAMAILLNSTP